MKSRPRIFYAPAPVTILLALPPTDHREETTAPTTPPFWCVAEAVSMIGDVSSVGMTSAELTVPRIILHENWQAVDQF